MRLLRFCTVPPVSIEGPPTITPLSLIAAGRKLPRLVMVPLLYMNPVVVPPENTVPAICPLLLIATACVNDQVPGGPRVPRSVTAPDRKSTRLNSSHLGISY